MQILFLTNQMLKFCLCYGAAKTKKVAVLKVFKTATFELLQGCCYL